MSEIIDVEQVADDGFGRLGTHELWPQPVPLPEARSSVGGAQECDWPSDTDPLAQGL